MPNPSRIAVREFFRRFARRCADILGSAEVFLLALLSLLIWGALDLLRADQVIE